MPVNPLAFYQNQEFLKLNQKNAISYIIARSRKALLMLALGLGSVPREDPTEYMTDMANMGLGDLQEVGESGGYALAYRTASGLSGSAALPDSNGSLAYAGSRATQLDALQFTPTYFYANTQITDAEVINANAKFGPMQWINWMLTKETGPLQALACSIGSTYSTTGENYQYDTLRAAQTISDATVEYEFSVNNGYRFHINMDVEIQNGSSAPYSNLGKGIVTYVGKGYGPVTIKIIFPNLAAPVSVAVNDPINMAGGYYWAVTCGMGGPNGWRSAALDTNYPRSEANNVQNTQEYFRPYAQDVSGQTINPGMLQRLNSALQGNTASTIGSWNGGWGPQARWQRADGKLQSREWYNANKCTIDEMATQRFNSGNENSPIPVATQAFFQFNMEFTTFNGTPFMEDDQTDIWELYLMNMSIWARGMLKPYGPMGAATTPGWQNNAASVTSQWTRNMAVVLGVLNRDRLGYLYRSDKDYLGQNPYLTPGP